MDFTRGCTVDNIMYFKTFFQESFNKTHWLWGQIWESDWSLLLLEKDGFLKVTWFEISEWNWFKLEVLKGHICFTSQSETVLPCLMSTVLHGCPPPSLPPFALKKTEVTMTAEWDLERRSKCCVCTYALESNGRDECV